MFTKPFFHISGTAVRALFAASLVFLSACGTQINTLRNAARITSGAGGVPPDLSSFAITDASPTNSFPLHLAYGIPNGTPTSYCVLENATDANLCVWRTGALPTTYFDSSADGSLALTLLLRNAYGTSAAVVSNPVMIDRTPPALASAAITNADPTNDPVYGLNYGAVTGAYSSYCIRENSTSVAGCVWQAGALPATFTVASSDGPKALYVWLRDDAGNVSFPTNTQTVTLSTAVPTVAITSPAAGSNITAANAALFAVSGTCSENGRNVVLSGAASATVVCSAGAWSTNLDFSGAADGAVTLYADHASASGTAATQASRVFNKDTSLPTVAVTSPAAGTLVNAVTQAAFAISGTCSENGRDVVLSGVASATVTCSGGTWSTTLDVSAAADGTITVYADHADAAGNGAVQSSRTFTKDVAAPTVAIASPAAGSYVNNASKAAFAISGTCSENGRDVVLSGADSATVACSGGTWSTTLDVSAAADGSITIYADHADAAGNAAAQASRTFAKDVGVPTVAIASPAAGTVVGPANLASFAVSGTCSENGRDVVITGDANATVSCAAGAWSANLDFTSAADGTVTILVNHADAAGNPAAQDTRSFTKDTGLPTVAITSPAAGTSIYTVNMGTFVVSGTCSENGRDVVLSGAASGTATCTAGAWSTTLDFSGASDGSVTLYADHSDSSGNNAVQASRAFTKDTGIPTLSIASPAAGSFVNAANVASFTVSGACSENGRDVLITGDASAIVSCSGGAWTANLDFTSAAAGTVSIAVNHDDAGGNAAVTQNRSFTKDVAAPTVAITSPAAGSFVTSANQTVFAVSGTCSENTRDVVLSGDATKTVACSSGTWSTTVDFSGAADGTVTLHADHADAAGNVATRSTRTFTKDTVVPSTATITIAGGSHTNDSTPDLSLSSTGAAEMYVTNVAGCGSGGAWETYATTKSGWPLDASQLNDTATVYAKFRDTAGNETACVNDTIVHDDIPPASPSIIIAGGAATTTDSTPDLALSMTEINSYRMYITNVAGCGSGGVWEAYAYTKTNWALDASQLNGTATVYVKFQDYAFNESACVSDTIVHDDTVPTVAISTPVAGAYIESSNQASYPVTGTCSESGRDVVVSGDASATVTCSASLTWTANLNFTAAAQGTVTIDVNHGDAAGNAAVQASRNFTKDTVSPTVAITSPAAMTSANLSTYTAFTVSGTCSESGAILTVTATHTASVTNTPTCTAGLTWTTNLNLTTLDQDTFTVTADLADAAGNAATPATRNFDKDTLPPNAANTLGWVEATPHNDVYVVSAWTKSNSGDAAVQKAQYYIDSSCTTADGPNADIGSATAQTYAVQTPGDGTYTYKVTTVDAAGNETISACSSAMTIDTVAPAAPTNLAYQWGPLSNQLTGNMTWTTSTSTDVVTQYGQSYSDGTCGTVLDAWTDLGSATLDSISNTASADGTYSYQIKAVDAAGNEGVSACSYAITIDTVAPTLASVTVTNSSPTSNQTYGLTYGAITDTYASYCIHENDTSDTGCTWTAGTVPATFQVTDVNEAKALSVFLKDGAGNVSAVATSNSVTYDNGIVLSPLTSTISATRSAVTIAGARASATTLLLANGDLLAAGGTGSRSDDVQITNSVLRFKTGSTLGNHKWSSLAPMLTARMLPGLVELANGNILAIGGCTITPYPSSHGTAATEVYVPADNRWYARADLNTPRCFHTTTLLNNGKVLVVGGRNAAGTEVGTYELYDPTADSWTQGTFAGGATLAGHSGTKLSDGRVFFAGGFGSAGWNQTGSFIYDPTTDSFASKASMAAGRQTHSSVLLTAAETGGAGDTVMVFGGYAGGFLNSVEAYDVATNAWTTKASMTNARSDFPNFAVNGGGGKVYIVGGTNGTAMTSVERYTWATNTWATRASLPYAQSNQILGMFGDGTVLSAGGYGTFNSGTPAVPFVLEYDKSANTWSNGIHLPRNAVNIRSIALSDGRALSCGGYDQGASVYLDTCWTYDPAVNGFHGVGKLSAPRHALRMVQMTNGLIAILAGEDNTGPRGELRFFNPTTDAFTTGATWSAPKLNPAVFALSGNRILVAGGLASSGGVATANAYIYDYATDAWTASTPMPSALGNSAFATTPSGKRYVHGGMNEVAGTDTFYGVLYRYDEVGDTWTTLASSATNREWHQLTPFVVGGNEYLLAAGGDQSQSFSTVLKSADKYDVANDAWTTAGNMATNRSLHVAYWPPGSDEIFEFGGYGGTQSAVYKYTISTGVWSTTTALKNNHYNVFTSSVPLADGRMFVFHGGGGGTYQKVAEIYNFATPVTYTASGGDRNFVFSLLSGAGVVYEKIRQFVPPYPLAGGPSRVKVTDGNGHSVAADANY